MITEDYVSFEIAKLLKEKGFECNYKNVIALEDIIEERFEGRTCVGEEVIPAGTFFIPEFGGEYETYDYSPNLFTASAPCPTQAMAMKWLREVHNLFIQICIISHTTITMEQKYYFFTIHKDRRTIAFRKDFPSEYYFTYEEACEEAIKYCLKNLI